MSLNTNTTSLDTIIRLIKDKTQYKGQIENELLSIEKELTALHAQARSALEGTGLSLVNFANTMQETNEKPSLEIRHWRHLEIGDIIRVTMEHDDPEDAVLCTVQELEDEDYSYNMPIRVHEELPDGSHWVDIKHDKWEFVSRP